MRKNQRNPDRDEHCSADKNSLDSADIRRAMHDEKDAPSIMGKYDRGEQLNADESAQFQKIYRRVYSRRYRQVHKDRLRKYHRDYLKKHPDIINAQQRHYRRVHYDEYRAKVGEYYRSDLYRQRNRKYYRKRMRENPEYWRKVFAKNAAIFRRRHPERVKKANLRSRAKHSKKNHRHKDGQD